MTPAVARDSSTKWQATRRAGSTNAKAGRSLRQISRAPASRQRGANLQPGGIASARGSTPGMDGSVCARSSPSCGTAAMRACVYGWPARSKTSSTSPYSTGAPAYITSTSSAKLAIDTKVVRDQHHGHPPLVREAVEKVDHAGLGRHVERRRRLVGDQGARGRTRAPSRSSPAAASHPRTRAGTATAGRAASARRPPREAPRPARPPRPWRRRRAAASLPSAGTRSS